MTERISLTEAERPVMDACRLDELWEDLRAAIIVSWRVPVPEVRREIRRAAEALIAAMEGKEPDTS